MFLKTFEVRWSDLDANRHVANAAYVSFMTHTRMAYLNQLGFDYRAMAEHNMGPAVFYEHIYYFREVMPNVSIQVSLEVLGLSEDGKFFEFLHNFYDKNGANVARCTLMGGWMDLRKRSLGGLPQDLLNRFKATEKHPEFRWLTKYDTRKHAEMPHDLNLK